MHLKSTALCSVNNERRYYNVKSNHCYKGTGFAMWLKTWNFPLFNLYAVYNKNRARTTTATRANSSVSQGRFYPTSLQVHIRNLLGCSNCVEPAALCIDEMLYVSLDLQLDAASIKQTRCGAGWVGSCLWESTPAAEWM